MILKALCNNFWLFAHETEVIGIFKVAYKIWYMCDLGPWLEEEEEGFSNRVSLFYNCCTNTCAWNVALFLFTLPVKFLLVEESYPEHEFSTAVSVKEQFKMFHQFGHLSPHYALVTLYLHVFNNKANILSEGADRNRCPMAFATVW